MKNNYLLIASALLLFSCQEQKTDKEIHADLLNNHPFSKTEFQTKAELKKIPKKDRPDLAFEQNFLLTLDPKTGQPEPSRLIPMVKELDKLTNGKTSNFKTSNDLQWEERGPGNTGGRTRSLIWDPNDPTGKTVWAGGVGGGIWKNTDITDANSQWVHVASSMSSYAVSAMAVDPTNSQVFYALTGETFAGPSDTQQRSGQHGAGIWKSIDGGDTWNHLENTSNRQHAYDMVVRDENGVGVIYTATPYTNAEIMRSTDGGASFDFIDLDYTRAMDLEVDADNNLWVGTNDGHVLKSTDGQTFTEKGALTGDRVELAIAPSNTNVIIALVNNGGGDVHRSLDGGTSWAAMSEPSNSSDGSVNSSDFTRGQAWYDLIAMFDPNDANNVLIGGVNVSHATNFSPALPFISPTWSDVSYWTDYYSFDTGSLIHADIHQIAFKPGSSDEVIIGTDGGVYYTNSLTTGFTNFESRNRGYNVTQFYAGDYANDGTTDLLVAGAQDNGTWLVYEDGISDGQEIRGGDGGYSFIDQDDPQYFITNYVQNNWSVQYNGGEFSLDNSSDGFFIAPGDYDSTNDCLFASGSAGNVFRYEIDYDAKSSEKIVKAVAGLTELITTIEVSPYLTTPSDADHMNHTIFLADKAGNIVRWHDLGSINTAVPQFTWVAAENLDPNDQLPGGSISSISVGANNDEVIVSFYNFGLDSVWRTVDAGQNWTSVEGNLPDMPIRSTLVNPDNTNQVLLGTEMGVWATNDITASPVEWTFASTGLGNVRVEDLRLRASDNAIAAITHGRGMFSTSSFENVLSTDNPSLNKEKITVYPNPTIGKIYANLPTDVQGDVNYTLTNLAGQTIQKGSFNGKLVKDFSGVSKGIYLLNLAKGKFNSTTKIMIK